jgi:hypothetical protein
MRCMILCFGSGALVGVIGNARERWSSVNKLESYINPNSNMSVVYVAIWAYK